MLDVLPLVVVHADWSSDCRKRWMASAIRQGDIYQIRAPELVGDLGTFIRRATQAARDGAAVLGFDFPIGIPAPYAHEAGIRNFLHALPEFGSGRWSSFYDLAEQPGEISVERPFYPLRPGNTRHAHLLTGLRVGSITDLLRRCEQARPDRGTACSLFWTLGGNQVGRAAIVGWRDVLTPALRSRDIEMRVWPFEGDLSSLLKAGSCVIVETYPAETCIQLGLGAPGRGWTKRKQIDRRGKSQSLLVWAQRPRWTPKSHH